MKLITWWKSRLWWVRWITYAIIAVVTFYGIEDLRGHRALERAKAEYLATGLRLDLDEIRGPEIPDEENLAACEIIRKAYADQSSGNHFIWPGAFPKDPSDATEVEYRGYRGKEWQFSDLEAEDEYNQRCRDALIEHYSPQLELYCRSAMRPSCDWSIVPDPTDFEAHTPCFPLIFSAARALLIYPSDPDVETTLPVPKLEMIIANLAMTKHLKTNSPILNQFLGVAIGEITLQSLADGIYHGDFTAKELNSISDRLKSIEPSSKKAFIEFETAVGFSRYSSPQEARRIYLENLRFKSGVAPIVEFPVLPIDINLTNVEDFLNRLIVAIIPRGWIWQGQALRVRTLLGATKTANPNPLHTLLWSEAEQHLSPIIKGEDEFQVSTRLAVVAVKVEIFRLKTGELPSETDFDTGSPNIGYGIEANGQPMLWYSENAPVASPPTGKTLEDYDEKHLWRYPPPEG
ncbi:MAG: hypothetical protein P1U86_16855 [Verrucomicrobiales bacterium]|nr:hypothetical protein [Verrucomicrobiales bacterium]